MGTVNNSKPMSFEDMEEVATPEVVAEAVAEINAIEAEEVKE